MRLRHILVDFLVVSFSSSSHFDYNRHGRQKSKVSIHGLLHQQYYWRASVGVKMKKIEDVYLLASERSERDTLRGNEIEISLYLFIYLFIYLAKEYHKGNF